MGVLNVIPDVRATKFSPLFVPGILGWWDFADPSQLYTDAGVTLVSSDGQTVQQVNDKSGNGVALGQSGAGARPTYKVNILNGKSVLRFDGGDVLFTSSPTITTPFAGDSLPLSVLIVTTTSALASNPAAWGASRSSNTTPFFFLQSRSGGVLRVDKRDDASTERFFDSAGSLIVQGTYSILSMISSATTAKTYANGSAGGTDGGTWADPTTSTIDRFAVGDFLQGGSATLPLTGDVAEVIVYNTALSAVDHNALGVMLATKYGFTWTAVI